MLLTCVEAVSVFCAREATAVVEFAHLRELDLGFLSRVGDLPQDDGCILDPSGDEVLDVDRRIDVPRVKVDRGVAVDRANLCPRIGGAAWAQHDFSSLRGTSLCSSAA